MSSLQSLFLLPFRICSRWADRVVGTRVIMHAMCTRLIGAQLKLTGGSTVQDAPHLATMRACEPLLAWSEHASFGIYRVHGRTSRNGNKAAPDMQQTASRQWRSNKCARSNNHSPIHLVLCGALVHWCALCSKINLLLFALLFRAVFAKRHSVGEMSYSRMSDQCVSIMFGSVGSEHKWHLWARCHPLD